MRLRTCLPALAACLALGLPAAAIAAPEHFTATGVAADPASSRAIATSQARQYARSAGYDVDLDCTWQFEPVPQRRADGRWQTDADLVCDG